MSNIELVILNQQYQMSNIELEILNQQYQMSNIELEILNQQYQMSNIKAAVLNQQYQMSKIELEIFSLGFSVFLLISFLCSLFFRFRLNINIYLFSSCLCFLNSLILFNSPGNQGGGWPSAWNKIFKWISCLPPQFNTK